MAKKKKWRRKLKKENIENVILIINDGENNIEMISMCGIQWKQRENNINQ